MREELHEKLRHTSGYKQFALYRQRMPELFLFTPLHWHSEFEINFIVSGCADYIVGDEKFTSQPGDIIIAAPNILHSAYPHGGVTQVYEVFLFSADMLGTAAGDRFSSEILLPIVSGEMRINPHIIPLHAYYGELRTSVENIISGALGDSAGLDLLIKSELARLFWLMFEAGDITKTVKRRVTSEMIRPAIDYMNLHYTENITVSQLAKTVSLSESYFMQKFRETAGISAIEYLNQIRVRAVCAQLAGTKKPTAEIAFGSGFRNLANFNRVFKSVTGRTPREMRG